VTLSQGKMYLTLTASNDWSGKLKFGTHMHRTNLNLPINYPRINQFQEWFPVEPEKNYRITDVATRKTKIVSGQELINGYEVSVSGNESLFLRITEK